MAIEYLNHRRHHAAFAHAIVPLRGRPLCRDPRIQKMRPSAA